MGFTGHAQSTIDPEPSFWDDVLFGGNLVVNFSNDFTTIIVAPQAIYQFNQYAGLGAGLNYSYSELDADSPLLLDYSSNIIGANVIGIVNPINEIQLSVDGGYDHVNRNFDNGVLDETYWVPSLFLGAGYNQNNLVIGVRYDVLYDSERSIFARGLQPFVRLLF